MRLVSYARGGEPRAGVLLGDAIAPLPGSLRDHLADVPGIVVADERVPLADVELLAPVPDPEKIICLGLNYHSHAAEAGRDVPGAPLWFGKFANSLVGHGAPIVLPRVHGDFVDYEAELAVVIGRPAHDVSAADALDHVAGVMAFNDVSARDLQLENPLWTSGKAIDTFAPCGPALVTLDEIGDLQSLTLRTRINGEVVQEGSASDMIFGVAQTLAWLSRTMTLVPGDIVATGTPAGVGGFKGVFLRPGDVVSVEVDGVGTVTNPVVAAVAAPTPVGASPAEAASC